MIFLVVVAWGILTIGVIALFLMFMFEIYPPDGGK